jgi:hypothetical protein
MDKYKDEETNITVHGWPQPGRHPGGLAALNAANVVTSAYNMSLYSDSDGSFAPVTAVVFGSPRTGNCDVFHRLPGL